MGIYVAAAKGLAADFYFYPKAAQLVITRQERIVTPAGLFGVSAEFDGSNTFQKGCD